MSTSSVLRPSLPRPGRGPAPRRRQVGAGFEPGPAAHSVVLDRNLKKVLQQDPPVLRQATRAPARAGARPAAVYEISGDHSADGVNEDTHSRVRTDHFVKVLGEIPEALAAARRLAPARSSVKMRCRRSAVHRLGRPTSLSPFPVKYLPEPPLCAADQRADVHSSAGSTPPPRPGRSTVSAP